MSEFFANEGVQKFIMYVVIAVFALFVGQVKNAIVNFYIAKRNLLEAELAERVGNTTAQQLMFIVEGVKRYAEDMWDEYTGDNKLALAMDWAKQKGLKVTEADIEIAVTYMKKMLGVTKNA